MARPAEKRPKTLADAVAELKRDPARPVHVRVDELEVELRVVERQETAGRLGDLMAAAGPWEGESEEEILRILREGRDRSSSDPPDMT